MIVSDTISSMFTTFLKPSWRLFWFYRKYGKLSQVLVTDDVIDILTNQFRVKRAHHRERWWKVSEYEKIDIVKIHLFCIIQLYNLGVLYENMNTSIKYVLQGHDEIKSVYRYFQKRCSYGMNHIFTTGTVKFSPNKSHNIGSHICTRTFGAVNFFYYYFFCWLSI